MNAFMQRTSPRLSKVYAFWCSMKKKKKSNQIFGLEAHACTNIGHIVQFKHCSITFDLQILTLRFGFRKYVDHFALALVKTIFMHLCGCPIFLFYLLTSRTLLCDTYNM